MKCQGCTKRRVGCRVDCEIWAAHEAEKAQRYARAEEHRRTYCDNQMAIDGYRNKIRAYRNKGGHMRW